MFIASRDPLQHFIQVTRLFSCNDHRRQFLFKSTTLPDCLAQKYSAAHTLHDRPDLPVQIHVSGRSFRIFQAGCDRKSTGIKAGHVLTESCRTDDPYLPSDHRKFADYPVIAVTKPYSFRQDLPSCQDHNSRHWQEIAVRIQKMADPHEDSCKKRQRHIHQDRL